MRKTYLRGGFTIETVLLMPLLLTVIMMVVYLNLYFYNRAIIQIIACRSAEKVFFYETQDSEMIEGKCAGVALKELNEMLVCMKEVEVFINVSAKETEVSIKGSLNVPDNIYLEALELENLWKIETKWTVDRLHAPSFIKTTHHSLRLMERISSATSKEAETHENRSELLITDINITGK